MANFVYALMVFRRRGIRFLWDYFRESLWFDIRHGTSTAQRVTKDLQHIELDAVNEEDGLLYVASFSSVTKTAVSIAHKTLGPDRARSSQFIDLGCGKGKALMVYSIYFGSTSVYPAIGIEYDPVLCSLARQNVANDRPSRQKVQIFTDSATNLRSYLSAKFAIIYLYNSFQGKTLIDTLSSLKNYPHILIYVDPAMRNILGGFGYRLVADHSGRYNADTWLVACSSDLDGPFI